MEYCHRGVKITTVHNYYTIVFQYFDANLIEGVIIQNTTSKVTGNGMYISDQFVYSVCTQMQIAL